MGAKASPTLREAGDALVPHGHGLMIGLMIGLMMPMAVLTSSRARGAPSSGVACDVDELRVGVLVGLLVEDPAGRLPEHGSAGQPG